MYKSYGTCRELMELRNLTTVGEIILMSALQRKGSCGGHYCLDDPARPVRIPCTTYPYHRLWLKLLHCLDDSVMRARMASFTACACHLDNKIHLQPWALVPCACCWPFLEQQVYCGACAEIIGAWWCRQWESQGQPSSAMLQRSSQRRLPSQGVRATPSLGQRSP